MLPDLNRLKVFYYIYKNKSVIIAANVLNITQSAVSQNLKKLEGELRIQLFTRLHKQLVPTKAGHQLYDMISPFINRLESDIKNIRLSHDEPYGLLRIGAPAEFGKRYLPRICAAFRQMYPEVSFELKLDHPDFLLPLLREGELDFAFADIFMKKGEFSRALSIYSIAPIFDEALILVCSGEYDQNRLEKDHGINRLLNAEYIAYQTGYPALKSWFQHHFKVSALNLKIVLTVENVEGVIAGVNHHMGLAVIPSHLVQDEIDRKDLVHIKKLKREIINRVSLVQLQDKIPSLTEKIFIRHFNSVIQLKMIPPDHQIR